MNFPFLRLALGLALCSPLLASAQAGQADPADAKAPAPALSYQSAFADYKPWQDIKAANWRAVNDNVRDAAAKGGGHGGHAAPSPSAASAAAPKSSSPAMPGHSGHKVQGGKQ
jgi:hypothetical protein